MKSKTLFLYDFLYKYANFLWFLIPELVIQKYKILSNRNVNHNWCKSNEGINLL